MAVLISVEPDLDRIDDIRTVPFIEQVWHMTREEILEIWPDTDLSFLDD